MFFFNHFINWCMISRSQLNSYFVSIQQFFYTVLFSEFSFITVDSKHSKRHIMFFHKNFATVSVLKLNKIRVFIHSIKSCFIMTSAFINFDWNRWTQSIFIFWNKLEIQMKWSVFSSRLRAHNWHDLQLTTYFSQF